jgi:hypothetical protein
MMMIAFRASEIYSRCSLLFRVDDDDDVVASIWIACFGDLR